MAGKKRKSVSGTKVLPEYAKRRKAPDFRGRVERAVMREWSNDNIRHPMYNHGKVPVDWLVPLVRRADGSKILDPTALLAVNTTIQWLFGTNVGLGLARKLLAIEERVSDEDRERLAKIPIEKRTLAQIL
jgi:hypothetical protein